MCLMSLFHFCPFSRLPLYIDPLPRSAHFRRPTDSFTFSENLDDMTEHDSTTALSTPQVERSLAEHSSSGDITDSTNVDGSSLTVPHDEDKTSHGSRPSTAFATPKTGMTPTSSENGDGSEATSRESTLNRSTKSVERRFRDQSPEEHNVMSQQSSEREGESNSPTSISTPSFDRLQLPTLDRPLEKSDNLSCTSTLTGSHGSLFLNDNGSRQANGTQHEQQQQTTQDHVNSLGINFNSKTKTASPRITKHEAKFNGNNGQTPTSSVASLSNFSINNADDVKSDRSESWELWPGNHVIDSASLSDKSHPPPFSSSATTNGENPPCYSRQHTEDKTSEDRTNQYVGKANANGEIEEERHSAGSGSFTNSHLDHLPPSDSQDQPPPYHTIFDAHTLSSDSKDLDSSTGTRPHHSSTGGYRPNEMTSSTGGRQLQRNLSNGSVPWKKLSLLEQESSSPEQYYSPMSRKCV